MKTTISEHISNAATYITVQLQLMPLRIETASTLRRMNRTFQESKRLVMLCKDDHQRAAIHSAQDTLRNDMHAFEKLMIYIKAARTKKDIINIYKTM